MKFFSTTFTSRYSLAISLAAFECFDQFPAISSTAAQASSEFLTANNPIPQGRCSLKPVSCSTTGLPADRKAALLSLNQPVFNSTNTFLHTLNSASAFSIYLQKHS